MAVSQMTMLLAFKDASTVVLASDRQVWNLERMQPQPQEECKLWELGPQIWLGHSGIVGVWDALKIALTLLPPVIPDQWPELLTAMAAPLFEAWRRCQSQTTLESHERVVRVDLIMAGVVDEHALLACATSPGFAWEPVAGTICIAPSDQVATLATQELIDAIGRGATLHEALAEVYRKVNALDNRVSPYGDVVCVGWEGEEDGQTTFRQEDNS